MCLWVAVTLIVGNATHSDRADGQEIAIIILYAYSMPELRSLEMTTLIKVPSTDRAVLFLMFTASLSISHSILIAHNATTVEHLNVQSMKSREKRLLNAKFEIWEIRFVSPYSSSYVQTPLSLD